LQGLTPVGKALRFRDADLVSAWERDYSGAVKAAIASDLKRLVNLLRAHRPLGDDDFDALADYLEAIVKHGPPRRHDTPGCATGRKSPGPLPRQEARQRTCWRN
jgi:hypothetical protein